MKDFLRRFKISYILYNFFRKKDLQHNEAMYNKLGLKKKYYSPVNSNDFENLPQETPWLDKEDSKQVLPNNQQFQALPTNIQNELINYSDKGYAILRGFFDTQTIDKIKALKQLILQSGSSALIEIDGGVTLDNAASIIAAGADVLVAGNTVFSAADPKATIAALKQL